MPGSEHRSRFVQCLQTEYSQAKPSLDEDLRLRRIFARLPNVVVESSSTIRRAYGWQVRYAHRNRNNTIALNIELIDALQNILEKKPYMLMVLGSFLAAVALHELSHWVMSCHSPVVVSSGELTTATFMSFGARAPHAGEFIERKIFGFMFRHHSNSENLYN